MDGDPAFGCLKCAYWSIFFWFWTVCSCSRHHAKRPSEIFKLAKLGDGLTVLATHRPGFSPMDRKRLNKPRFTGFCPWSG